MIPFLPTLANSDPWLTTNSFCSESSSTLTSMPWGGKDYVHHLWPEDKVKVDLATALLISKYGLTLGSYSAFTVTGCLYTSSDPPSSSSLSKIIVFHVWRRSNSITSSLWPRWKMPQLPSCWKITLKYIFLTMKVPRRPRPWWQHSSQCHEEYFWDLRQ